MNANNSITESLASIQESLATIALSSGGNNIASWVIPALVGSISAYLFNLFHWRMVEKKQEYSSLNKVLNDNIEELEKSSIEYWLAGSENTAPIKNKQMELSIKSRLTIIRKTIKSINSILDKKLRNPKKTTETIATLKNFESEIYDLITGDEFESFNRSISTERAIKISKQCSEIRAFLSNLDYTS